MITLKHFCNAFFLFLVLIPGTHTGSTPTPALQYNLVVGLPDIYIHPDSEKIGHTWYHGDIWEKHLIQKFYSMLPKNKHFVALDLGAQTGCFSLLAKYFSNSEWYAFEPITEAAAILTENLRLNNINNVQVFEMAASHFCGTAILTMPPMHAWGVSTLGTTNFRFDPAMQRTVKCIDLDTFVEQKNIKKIDFIKIDTEGFELFILKGAKNMILKDRPIIVMEYSPINMRQCGVTPNDVDNFLRELGYQWMLISSEDLLCIPIPQ